MSLAWGIAPEACTRKKQTQRLGQKVRWKHVTAVSIGPFTHVKTSRSANRRGYLMAAIVPPFLVSNNALSVPFAVDKHPTPGGNPKLEIRNPKQTRV
jgi:hypothetical protein